MLYKIIAIEVNIRTVALKQYPLSCCISPEFRITPPVKGGIPYPDEGEKAEWGHAIVAVGYDNAKKIKNTNNHKETIGALLIRNSWRKGWGDKGYGWMPYDYILNNLALDFWSLLGMDWVDSGQFGF